MDTACPEGSHKDVRRMPRRSNWTISSDEAFVDLLLDENEQSGACSGSFKLEAWLRICNLYQQITKEDTTLLQLKSRWKTLKKLYNLYASLLAKSGWLWDFENQRPTPGSPTVWEEIIKLNKEYKVCRDKPFPLYPKIHDLVASSTATGEYGIHTGASLRGDDFVHNLEESSGSSDTPMREVENFTKPPASGMKVPFTNAPSTSKRKQVTEPRSQLSKRKSSEEIVEALNRLICLSDRRSNLLEQSKKVADRYSYMSCMEKLATMPGVSDTELFIASEALKSLESRAYFMMMR